MEDTDSIQTPLLNHQSVLQECAYLKTNILSNYSLHWVGKLVSIGN